jgi:hypothetical protein
MNANRRRVRVFGSLAVGLCTVIVAIGAFAVGHSGAVSPAAATATPPYGADPAATLGGIDFFNAAGTLITTGSTTTAPFAAYAIAQNAPASGVKAAYYAYTPVNGTPPGQWGGAQLGGGTAYPISTPTDLAALTNPIVTGGSGDMTLADFISSNPNNDKSTTDGYAGLYAIRIKVTGQAGYAEADIVVSGTTWTQADGSYTSPAKGGGSAPTTTNTAVSANPSSPITAGASVTFTATVTPTAPGSVQFMDGLTDLGSPVTVTGGTAPFTTTTLPAGTHSITAVFAPTDSTAFGPSTSTALSYVVNTSGAATTSTAIAAQPDAPVTFGTTVTFTATVTPDTAPGTVQFMDGTNTIGSAVTVASGSATFPTSSLPVGTDSITAVFTPTDSNAFGSSTSPALGYEVDASTAAGPKATVTTLVASPVSPTTAGTPVTFTATVTPSAAGSVQFIDGTTDLGSPVQTITGTTSATAASAATTTLPVGTDSITAVFTPADSSSFITSTSDALSYVVSTAGASPTTTATVVTANPASPITAGTSVTFTATVTPSAAGSVQFIDGTTDLGSAVQVTTGTTTATATSPAITTLPTGTDSITAVFTPNDSASFAPSTSPGMSYVVTAAGVPLPTTTTLTSSLTTATTTTGTPVTFTATLAPITSVGTVQFMNGSTTMGSPVALSSGVATYPTSFGAAGSYPITAVFTPTNAAAYTTSTSATITVVVTGATVTSTALAVTPAGTAPSGTDVQLTATVTPTTALGSVTFYDGSTSLGTQALASGSATLSTSTLGVGSTHSFVAIFTPTNSTVTDPTAFIGSQSPAVAYTITAATSTTPTLLGPDGSTLSSDPTLTMGETITVQASGFTAGESVSAVVHSTPETLTPATASSTGTISYAFTVPSDLLTGAHTLVLTGATSQTTVTVDFSIASPAVLGTTTTSTTTPSAGSASLPFTGSDIELLAAIGIACTGVGLAMRTRKGTPRYVAGHEWRRRH